MLKKFLIEKYFKVCEGGKECETKNFMIYMHYAIMRNIKPKLLQQNELAKKNPSFGELSHENCRNMFFKTGVNFGCCYGNMGAWKRLKHTFLFWNYLSKV